MPRILALLPNPAAQARLNAASHSPATAQHAPCEVRHVMTWTAMHQAAREWTPQVVAFDPYANGRFDGASCAAFHQRFPAVVLLAYGAFSTAGYRDAIQLAQMLGAGNLLNFSVDDDPVSFGTRLRGALESSLVGRVLAALGNLVPPDLVPLFRFLLTADVDKPLTPARAAKSVFQHPRTLRKHLHRAGLPTTEPLIVWCRLLRAAHLLDGGVRTVGRAAGGAGFGSGAAFGNALKRYTGLSPTELRTRGGVEWLLEIFRERCSAPKSGG